MTAGGAPAGSTKIGLPVTSQTVFRLEAEEPLSAWPLILMVAAYPVWFLLGLAGFMWVILAVPMLAVLVRRRNLVVPKGLFLWGVFLVAVLGSILGIDTIGRLSGWILRYGYYLGATVMLLYLLNGGRGLTIWRIVRMFTLLWLFTIAGGYLAFVLGGVSFKAPMGYLMPQALLANDLIKTLVTPGFADVHDFIGFPVPRPKAPFPFTNSWGSMLALLTPFGLMAAAEPKVGVSPRLVRVALVASLVPAVVSLNRGLWLSLGVGLLYAGFRFGFAGKGRLFGRMLIAGIVLAMILAISPLGGLVSSRFSNGHSDEDRTSLAFAAVEGSFERPVFGWGSPRPNVQGLPSIGTHGQLWFVMFSYGFVGLVGYIGALLSFLYWTRTQTTTVGLWAHTVLIVAMVQLPFYLQVPHQLFAVFAAVAVALRAQQFVGAEGGLVQDFRDGNMVEASEVGL